MSNNEYYRRYMNNRYHERRAMVLKMLGGACVQCGADNDLQIDHKDPDTKNFTVGDRLDSAPWGLILVEIKKCQLLCLTCHQEKSREEGPHNRYGSYECSCGAVYDDRLAYAGHRRWCTIGR